MLALWLSLVALGVESCARAGLAPMFSVPPLDLANVKAIIPLGHLDARSGHVLPSDHIYFDYGGNTHSLVRAPATGTVYAVRNQRQGGAKIELRVDDNITYYLAHVLLEPEIVVGSKLNAGQVIGQVSGGSMLDLGVCDARVVAPGLLNPKRYPEQTLHAIAPLSVFGEELSDRLYAKVTRRGAQKDGQFDYDQAGKLVGNWFHESLPEAESGRGGPETWAKQLAFVYDVHEPSAIRISIGGSIAPPGVYAVQRGDPDPATVGVRSGRVKYHLQPLPTVGLRQGPGTDLSSGDQKILLVQLLSQRKLKVQYLADEPATAPAGFNSRAAIYER